jgi:hypothetical protein
VVLVLNSVYMLYYIYRFIYVEPSLHPWQETNLVMMYDLFNILLDSVCKYLLGIFVSMFIKEIGLIVFLCVSLFDFWNKSNTYWFHRMSLVVFLPFLFLGLRSGRESWIFLYWQTLYYCFILIASYSFIFLVQLFYSDFPVYVNIGF